MRGGSPLSVYIDLHTQHIQRWPGEYFSFQDFFQFRASLSLHLPVGLGACFGRNEK